MPRPRWLGLAAVALGILLLPLSRGYNQLVMYGAALLIASLPVLVLSGIAWLTVQLAYGTSLDPLVAGTSDLARDVCWFVVLSYLVYLALALWRGEALAEKMRGHGLSEVRWYPLTFGIATLYVGTKGVNVLPMCTSGVQERSSAE